MARPPKKPWPAAVIVAESVLELVAELRYYLGGENYTSGRYAGTHVMLFSVEHHLRALDLDGDGMLVRGDEIISLPASEVMLELVWAMERLSELVEDMKAAAEAAAPSTPRTPSRCGSRSSSGTSRASATTEKITKFEK
uniref:Uncharacterized protein n=1 Tax=Setaria viridis TaxID=4556 RepID=A0A4U6VZM3_SETVI|nr:hypothetical protein SEVIR_2G345100v2 [Setaria viridis]